MNTIAINFEMLFDLHKSKIPKELLYKLIECNIKSGDKETIYILKLTLIQKWLRDTHKIIVLPRFHNKISVYSYWIIKNENELPLMPSNGFDTYESALMEGTNEALQLI